MTTVPPVAPPEAQPAGSPGRPPVTHQLKIYPAGFDSLARGDREFEYRRADRDYRAGDTLDLRSYDPHSATYTGQQLRCRITEVNRDRFGLPPDYALLGVADVEIISARTHEGVKCLLCLVGIEPDEAVVAAWSEQDRALAENWAEAVHFAASDNDVEVPPRPAFLPQPWQGPPEDWGNSPTPMKASAAGAAQ